MKSGSSFAVRWLQATSAIFSKDIKSELRTRYALNALVMFVITTLSIILFALGGEAASSELMCGVLWIIIFFSTMSGMSRSFVSEEERGTVLTLQLMTRPSTVFFGKLFFNFVLLSGTNLLSIVLYLVLITNFVVHAQ